MLNRFGAWLKQGFSGTGYDGETRVMGDSGSRLYILEREDETPLLGNGTTKKLDLRSQPEDTGM